MAPSLPRFIQLVYFYNERCYQLLMESQGDGYLEWPFFHSLKGTRKVLTSRSTYYGNPTINILQNSTSTPTPTSDLCFFSSFFSSKIEFWLVLRPFSFPIRTSPRRLRVKSEWDLYDVRESSGEWESLGKREYFVVFCMSCSVIFSEGLWVYDILLTGYTKGVHFA